MVFHRYVKLKQEGRDDYAAVLLDCLTSDDVFPPPDAVYMQAIGAALRNYDMMERAMHKELDKAILGDRQAPRSERPLARGTQEVFGSMMFVSSPKSVRNAQMPSREPVV
jgi:hypothetical protein